MSIGKVIWRRRESLNLSRRQMAERAGISPNGIEAVEKDRTHPTIPYLLSLCSALDIPLSLLLQEAGLIPDCFEEIVQQEPRLTERGKRALVELWRELVGRD